MIDHCKNCGLRLSEELFRGETLLHSDGYMYCPPAFGTVAEKEEQ